jgi:hypothetical protein
MSTDLVWVVPTAVGALGLATVGVWRLVKRWRFRCRVRTQTRRLASFDPGERLGGALAVVELGLTRRSAGALLAHVADEEDHRVRVAIAQSVGQAEERSGRRRMRRLQAWAADEVAAQGPNAMPVPARTPRTPSAQNQREKPTKRKKKPPRISWQAPAPHS